MRHKHADAIKAWAEGAEIECQISPLKGWVLAVSPSWDERFEYRIKPTPKPDVKQKWFVAESGLAVRMCKSGEMRGTPIFKDGEENLLLTFDGETGKLKSAEVL
jgi:hypothetical protein